VIVTANVEQLRSERYARAQIPADGAVDRALADDTVIRESDPRGSEVERWTGTFLCVSNQNGADCERRSHEKSPHAFGKICHRR